MIVTDVTIYAYTNLEVIIFVKSCLNFVPHKIISKYTSNKFHHIKLNTKALTLSL